MDLLYWHWIVFGIFLVLLELVIPSFTALWFGIGGVLVGMLLLVEPDLSTTFQISAWAILSALLTSMWFKILKPSRDKIVLPALDEIQGELGVTLTPPSGERPGRVRFSTPIKGYDEWDFESDDQLAVGDAVKVTGVTEHRLVMKKQ